MPARTPVTVSRKKAKRVVAIIPTYGPGTITRELVKDLLSYNPTLLVWVVDDSTPHTNVTSMAILTELRSMDSRVKVLRTPANKLKAGALNFALGRLFAEAHIPDIIMTLDDDVVITKTTIDRMVEDLVIHPTLGAVCSQCHVLNKNSNLLTRLQGLEYVGFNATRLADEGLLQGPLVMHGMLAAFRREALQGAPLFKARHLIEDYEITTRIKAQGWSVKLVPHALAWTVVPEGLGSLWRQRTRWTYGGLHVLARASSFTAVIQDVIGHTLFFLTAALVVALLLTGGDALVPPIVARVIVLLSLTQLIAWYSFQLWLMRFYDKKDALDWLLRITILPEFIYSYFLTAALLGSYMFYVYRSLARKLGRIPSSLVRSVLRGCDYVFKQIGYSDGWERRTAHD